jgi:hypothetical protein
MRWFCFVGVGLLVGLIGLADVMASAECPRLLRITGKKTEQKLSEAYKDSFLALHSLDPVALMESIQKMEAHHSLELASHIAQLVPMAVLLTDEKNDRLLPSLLKSVQKREWNILSDIMRYGVSSDDEAEDILEALRDINAIRPSSVGADLVEFIWRAIETNPVHFGERLWMEDLHIRYLNFRTLYSFSEAPRELLKIESFPSLIRRDYLDEESHMVANFFTQIIDIHLVLASMKDYEIYSMLGIHQQQDGMARRIFDPEEVEKLLEAVEIFEDSEADNEREDESGDEEALSDSYETKNEINFSAIAGIPSDFDEARSEEEASDQGVIESDRVYDRIKDLLNRIYHEENPPSFDLESIRNSPGFRLPFLYEAYLIEEREEDYGEEAREQSFRITPLQMLVLSGLKKEALELQKYLVENRVDASIWLLPPHPYPLAGRTSD